MRKKGGSVARLGQEHRGLRACAHTHVACVWAHVCACVHACARAYAHVCAHVHVCIFGRVHVHMRSRVCTNACVCVHVWACVCTHVCAHARVRMCACMRACVGLLTPVVNNQVLQHLPEVILLVHHFYIFICSNHIVCIYHCLLGT